MAGGDDGRWELADDDLTGASGAGWESLELDTDDARSPQPSADPLAHMGGRIIGDPFDGLGGSDDAAAPDLDVSALRASAPSPVARAERPGKERSERGALEARAAEPAIRFAPSELDLVADFGAAPNGLLGAIPYAILVLTRRRALKAALTDLKRLEATASGDHDHAQAELGRALHAQRAAPTLAVLEAHLAAADAAGRVAGQRTEERAQARETADSQRASLDAKIAEAERSASPYRDRETKLATQMSVRETDMRRASARLSRVVIELRNAGPSGEATDAAREQLLEAERAARQAEAKAAQAQVDELAPKLAEARRELAVRVSAINDLSEQRRAVEAAQTRSEHVHASTAGEAERGYHTMLRELAAQALARGLAEAIAPEAARAASRARAALDTRAREVALHAAALDAYDKPAFQKGAIVLASAALVVLVTLLFVILR